MPNWLYVTIVMHTFSLLTRLVQRTDISADIRGYPRTGYGWSIWRHWRIRNLPWIKFSQKGEKMVKIWNEFTKQIKFVSFYFQMLQKKHYFSQNSKNSYDFLGTKIINKHLDSDKSYWIKMKLFEIFPMFLTRPSQFEITREWSEISYFLAKNFPKEWPNTIPYSKFKIPNWFDVIV